MGQVFVGLKDLSFEPSSPIHHTTELLVYDILQVNDLAHNSLAAFTLMEGQIII